MVKMEFCNRTLWFEYFIITNFEYNCEMLLTTIVDAREMSLTKGLVI